MKLIQKIFLTSWRIPRKTSGFALFPLAVGLASSGLAAASFPGPALENSHDEFTSEARLAFSKAPQEKLTAYETWNDNLFVHFALDPKEVQKALPPPFFVDTYPDANGQPKAWVTVWGFRQENTRLVNMPSWAGSTFPDLHIHTAVRDLEGKEFSQFTFRIWVDNHFAAFAGRWLYGAPMYYAHQSIEYKEGKGLFRSDTNQGHHLTARWEVQEKLNYNPSSAHTREVFLHDRFQQAMIHQGKKTKVRHTKPMWELYSARLTQWECHLEGLQFTLPFTPSYITYGKKMNLDVYETHQF